MKVIFVNENTHIQIHQLKASLQAKNVDEVIQYLLFRDKKEKER